MSQPPSQVSLAVKLMYAGAVLWLLNVVLLPLQSGQIRAQLREQDARQNELQYEIFGSSAEPTIDIDALATTTIAVGVVSALIGAGVWIWMARMHGQGKNWARITGTVLGAINITLIPIGIVAGAAIGSASTPVSTVTSLVGVGLIIAILVLVWRPASSAWFASMQPTRAPVA